MSNGQMRLDFRKYTKQIWLAGLGAFSKAEEEGGRLFDSLVQMGSELEAKTKELNRHQFKHTLIRKKEAKGALESKDEQMENTVQQMLGKADYVSVRDFQALEKLVLELHKKLDLLLEGNQDFKKNFDEK